jgi:hypothetical protein
MLLSNSDRILVMYSSMMRGSNRYRSWIVKGRVPLMGAVILSNCLIGPSMFLNSSLGDVMLVWNGG